MPVGPPKLTVVVCCRDKEQFNKVYNHIKGSVTNDEFSELEILKLFNDGSSRIIDYYGEGLPDKILFIQQDCLPIEGWYHRLMEAFKKADVVGIDGTTWISTHVPLFSPLPEEKIYGDIGNDDIPKDGKKCVCIGSAFIGVKKHVLEKIKFDENFKILYGIDFSLRACLHGFDVRVFDIPTLGYHIPWQGQEELTPELNSELILFSKKWSSKGPYLEIKEG